MPLLTIETFHVETAFFHRNPFHYHDYM